MNNTETNTFGNIVTNIQKTINRGPKPTKKVSDFDLVALRHTELRKVPNPSNEKLALYDEVINIAIKKFLRNNYTLLANNMLELDDLKSYAQMWTITFIGLWEQKDKPLDENKKILMNNLKQRLLDFKKALIKRNLNEFPNNDTPSLNDFIAQFQKTDHFLLIPVVHPKEYKEEEVKKKKIKEQKNLLAEKLNSLSHDDMVEKLLTATSNEKIHFDARKEASKLIRRHVIECIKCRDLKLPVIGYGDTTEYTNRPILDESGTLYANPSDAADKLDLYASNIRNVLIGKYTHTGGHSFKYADKSIACQ